MARTSQAGCQAAIQGLITIAGPWFFDLSNVDPTTTGATGLATTRQSYTASTATAAIPSVVSNTNALTVPTTGATAANYAMLYDATTAGNYRTGAALSSPVTAASITVAAGAASWSAQ